MLQLQPTRYFFSERIGLLRDMIYRINVNDPDVPEGERWFARQIEGQFANVDKEPLPPELRELLIKLSDVASKRPLS